MICPTGLAKNFLRGGWTRKSQISPSGKSVPSVNSRDARGWAHIGAIDALTEAGIQPAAALHVERRQHGSDAIALFQHFAEGRRLIGPFAQVFLARLSCQCHQSTTPTPRAAIEISATIRAEASIHAAAGTQSAMMTPRRQICQERI